MFDKIYREAVIYCVNADEKQKKFFDNLYMKNVYTGQIKSFDYDNIIAQNKGYLQNFVNSFVKKAITEKKVMCMLTSTVKKEYRICKYSDFTEDHVKEKLLDQHHLFQRFQRYMSRVKRRYSADYEYFRVYELHKSGDIHTHQMIYIEDDLDSIVRYIDLVRLARNNVPLGRMDLRLPNKYKEKIIHQYGLIQSKYDSRIFFFNKSEFKTGASLIVTFFDKDDTEKNVTSYIMKYLLKSKGGQSREYYLFRYLKIRSYSYSQYMVSFQAYKKIFSQIVTYNKNYRSFYEFDKDVQSGKICMETVYETADAIIKISLKPITHIDHIDTSNGYPIIYTSERRTIHIKEFQPVLKQVIVYDVARNIIAFWQTGDWQKIDTPVAGLHILA